MNPIIIEPTKYAESLIKSGFIILHHACSRFPSSSGAVLYKSCIFSKFHDIADRKSADSMIYIDDKIYINQNSGGLDELKKLVYKFTDVEMRIPANKE